MYTGNHAMVRTCRVPPAAWMIAVLLLAIAVAGCGRAEIEAPRQAATPAAPPPCGSAQAPVHILCVLPRDFQEGIPLIRLLRNAAETRPDVVGVTFLTQAEAAAAGVLSSTCEFCSAVFINGSTRFRPDGEAGREIPLQGWIEEEYKLADVRAAIEQAYHAAAGADAPRLFSLAEADLAAMGAPPGTAAPPTPPPPLPLLPPMR